RREPIDWQAHTWPRKMMRLLRLFASHEVPGARVRLAGFRCEAEAITDREGFALFELELEDTSPPRHAQWNTVELTLPDHDHRAEAPVLAAGTDGRLGVISDIDDTIIETGAHDFARNWRRVLMQMPGDRVPVPGAADLYSRLASLGPGEAGPIRRPFFYISSSPWNLYGFLEEFMRQHALPKGPMLLRDWGLNRATLGRSSHGAHKTRAIETILDFYPDHRFILLGDDTQGDAEAYATAVRDYPGRVAAVFIRMAGPEPPSGARHDALEAIRAAGTPVWTGSAYDEGHQLLDTLGLDRDPQAEQLVEATEPEV
ncbi:MAG: App1 family protein, partial [Parasphingopyxis sp.]